MGCYDEVVIKCPACGALHTVQSKAGSCKLTKYAQSKVPHAVAFSIAKYYTLECSCGVTSRPQKVRNHFVPIVMRPVNE